MRERRKHPRFKVKQPVTAVVRLPYADKILLFSILNISNEGMLIAGELEAVSLKDGETISIELFSSAPREQIVLCQARVIDFRGDGKFGVHIEEISKGDQQRMMSMCADFEQVA